MLYTGKGDSGTSALFGSRQRRGKQELIFEVLGGLDELVSWLGVCRASARRLPWPNDGCEPLDSILADLQQDLFVMQAELAGADKRVSQARVARLERRISAIEHLVPPIQGFRLPGATRLSAELDYARTLARRMERELHRHAAASSPKPSPAFLAYANRLSSMLYALARYAAHTAGVEEMPPAY